MKICQRNISNKKKRLVAKCWDRRGRTFHWEAMSKGVKDTIYFWEHKQHHNFWVVCRAENSKDRSGK